MGKKFEITYNHYGGTECRDDLFSYAERYVLDYVSETEEDGVIELTTKTTGGSVRLSSSRFNGNIVSCDSNEFEDGVFYDVTSAGRGCVKESESVWLQVWKRGSLRVDERGGGEFRRETH